MIASHTPEGTPSPLSEMYWSWNSGYRHVVLNFTVTHGAESGGGYVHIGSRDCGPTGGKALEDRDRCTYLNTRASRSRTSISSATRSAWTCARSSPGRLRRADLRRELGGDRRGAGHRVPLAPSQPDCATLFGNFGLDMPSGDATAAANHVFVKR